jgi:hypothetical protein
MPQENLIRNLEYVSVFTKQMTKSQWPAILKWGHFAPEVILCAARLVDSRMPRLSDALKLLNGPQVCFATTHENCYGSLSVAGVSRTEFVKGGFLEFGFELFACPF